MRGSIPAGAGEPRREPAASRRVGVDPRDADEPEDFRPPCPYCGGRIVIEVFERWRQPEDRRMRRRRTGETTHDLAWRIPASSRRRCASGNGPARARGDCRRRQAYDEHRAGPTIPRRGVTKRPVRVHHRTSHRRSSHRRNRPQFEIPIAIDCGPRVPA